MSFISENDKAKMGNISREDADRLEYGAVKVDANGKVLMYNRYESELAGVNPAVAEGKNFFIDIAPCTNNRLFLGKFKDGVASKKLDVSFNYTFTYKMKPTSVEIHLLHQASDQSNWILVKKKAA